MAEVWTEHLCHACAKLDSEGDDPCVCEPPASYKRIRVVPLTRAEAAEARVAELENVVRLLAGGWYFDAASDPDYADLFECGWLSKNSDEPGDYSLTLDGQVVIDDALKQIALKGKGAD